MEYKRSSHYDGFESNFERDKKSVPRLISSLMKSQSNFGKLTTKYKIRLNSFCSLHLGHRIYGALPILCIAEFKGREK